jgi:hypothetical protein
MNEDAVDLESTISLMPGSQGLMVTRDLGERQVEAPANALVNREATVSTVARQMFPRQRAR